ncbi:uncharacterized protein Z518_06722 [Rhinocladiella mackenziei CBS 650.93]|uniref:Heterokaryon incompatibility domain-containing protein n=1 Tax=Rhinocladiella mackenziei CBS 650.93 TaxID=1442369 RepID=A0A0D2IIP9_9EURO|nr:uncharacterized protein Z518_06722 [Rhinocladiella mackenziei CBS 650.93]KIX03171.1 hypothetical protein Z518_06722 [Rhinocladiella mackenziei CBS 650.93]
MDHIPQATRSPHSPIKIPFVVSERFQPVVLNQGRIRVEVDFDDDGRPLFEISKDDEETTPEALSRMTDILDFYQARCFFGLLASAYSAAGKLLDMEIYIDRSDEKQVVLTTKRLLPELEDIFIQQATLMDAAKVEKYMQMDNAIQESENLTFVLQKFAVDLFETLQANQEANQTRRSELWMIEVITESAAMLRETILTASRQTYLPVDSSDDSALAPIFGRDLPIAPDNILCMDRFHKAGWCPRQATEVASTILRSRSVAFSLSSIDRRDAANGNHSMCSTAECVLENIDNDAYEPMHTMECGGDNCPLVPSREDGYDTPSALIAQSVRSNCIPAISVIEKPNGEIFLGVRSYRPCPAAPRSPFENRLMNDVVPEDSLQQSLVEEYMIKLCDDPVPNANRHETSTECSGSEELFPSRNVFDAVFGSVPSGHLLPYIAISHVWSQGLGNRRSNSLPLCQLRRLQRFVDALVPQERRPVPFWIDTICVPLEPTARDAAIKAMRIVYRDAIAVLAVDSTLTEFDLSSVSGGNCGQSSLQTWQVEILMRIKAAPWAQRLWTYHEACLAQQLYFQLGGLAPAIWSLDIAGIEDSLPREMKRINRGDTIAKPEGMTSASKEELGNSSKKQPVLMPLEYTRGYLFVEAAALQLFGKDAPDSSTQDFSSDLRYLSRQLALRTTSRLQDEAVCLSTLLGLEPAAVMSDKQGELVPDEERMMRLWEVLEPAKIPAGILFCNRPIYGKRGSGWMVKSLLRDDRGNWIDGMGCGNVSQKDQDLGILVEMGGLEFEIDDMDRNTCPWNVVLSVAGYKYRILEVEASQDLVEWRRSGNTGKFAILMPQIELKALLEDVEYRVNGLGSHTSALPFGLLVSVPSESETRNVDSKRLSTNSTEDVLHVCRREMVEFEILLDDEDDSAMELDAVFEGEEDNEMGETASSADGISTNDHLVEVKVVSETQKWWVG